MFSTLKVPPKSALRSRILARPTPGSLSTIHRGYGFCGRPHHQSSTTLQPTSHGSIFATRAAGVPDRGRWNPRMQLRTELRPHLPEKYSADAIDLKRLRPGHETDDCGPLPKMMAEPQLGNPFPTRSFAIIRSLNTMTRRAHRVGLVSPGATILNEPSLASTFAVQFRRCATPGRFGRLARSLSGVPPRSGGGSESLRVMAVGFLPLGVTSGPSSS